jgi:hypothetical protein
LGITPFLLAAVSSSAPTFLDGQTKMFNLYESLSLELEVQAQNAFNHANLANPTNTCVDCAGNGQITDILGGTFAGMRQLQFVARFSF